MNFDSGVHELSLLGLNIFLSAKVSNLPEHFYPFKENQKEKTLCLIANGGKTLWENINVSKSENPFDDFSVNQMHWFGKNILDDEIEILYPNTDIILPLQQLGRYFNFSQQSPIGIDISNEFGLWFAFRGVFLTNKIIPMTTIAPQEFPCESCFEKPCLGPSGVSQGRLNCPVKINHRYPHDQLEFHTNVLHRINKA